MAANPSIQLGTDGNWAIKEDNLLAYKKDGTRFFNKEFDFTRNTTATFVDKDGLIKVSASNTPRINYTNFDYENGVVVPYSGEGSFLLEPQSTNLLQYSEDFSNSYWSKIGSGSGIAPIVTAEYAISPDGIQNATRVQFDAVGSADSDRSGLVRNFAFTTGQTYSISCWVKSTNETNQIIQFRLAGAQVSEEQIATSEWKLYTATFTATASVTDNFGMQIRGVNSVNESDILIYGMQLELSNYPTSYIPTSGSTATRLADVCNNSGTVNDFNSEEGVLYFEGSVLDISTPNSWISVSEDANFNSNQFNLRFVAGVNLIQAVSIAGGLGQDVVLQYTLSDKTTINKIAIKYKLNDWALWVNGIEVDTETSSVAFTSNSLDILDFDRGNNSSQFYGNVKSVAVFKRALSDGELYLLTVTQYQSYQEMATALNYTL